MFQVYVIENLKGKKYTGSTDDISERLEMHNDLSLEKFKFHKTTYKKGPWKLIFSKDFASRGEALTFEKYLKSGKGREWLEKTI
jgi:putative endonuclease